MTTGSHSEPCINWPCAMRKGHVGPCSTSPEQRSSNSAVYEVQEGMDRDLNKQFRVTDTRTDSRVATCYVQSNADLVCAALNAYTADEPTSVRASNEQLAQALRNLRDVAHREVSPRYSAALDKAFTLADIALGEFDSEGDVSREADVGPGGGVRATHATGSAPSKPGAAEPPKAAQGEEWLERLRRLSNNSLFGVATVHCDELRALISLVDAGKSLPTSQQVGTVHDIHELLEIARDISSMDCFRTGNGWCEPECSCLAARAGRAVHRQPSTKNVLHCPHDKDPDDCMHCADRQPDETKGSP